MKVLGSSCSCSILLIFWIILAKVTFKLSTWLSDFKCYYCCPVHCKQIQSFLFSCPWLQTNSFLMSFLYSFYAVFLAIAIAIDESFLWDLQTCIANIASQWIVMITFSSMCYVVCTVLLLCNLNSAGVMWSLECSCYVI